MDDDIFTLNRAGASSDLIGQFRAVIESERFAGTGVGRRLAAIIAGMGGRNKDSAVLELCHLVHGLAGLGVRDGRRRLLFFLSQRRVTPGAVHADLERIAGERAAAPANVTLGERGLVIDYGGERFEIWYRRMPALIALFEFLMGLDGGVYATEFVDTLDTIPVPPAAVGEVKPAAGRIAKRLRDFRQHHIAWARHQEHFDRIAMYFKKHVPGGDWIIDDNVIFDFWTRHSHGVKKPIREYETVFRAFVDLAALAMPPDQDDLADWEDPLDVLDQPGAREIGVLKGASERKPIARLMEHGPNAGRFPHAFLRLESFAPVQSTVANARRFGRGTEAIRRSVACEDAVPYGEAMATVGRVREHLRTMQKAVYHCLYGDARSRATPEFRAEAAAAFRGIRRKGFESAEPDADRREAFAEFAGALTRMTGLIDGFRKSVERRGASAGGLDAMFTRDRDLFAAQFRRLYGEPQ